MNDGIHRVLRLVAEGKLTAEEAAPILDALDGGEPEGPRPAPRQGPGTDADGGGRQAARSARIEIFEGGKRRVNLRVPISLGRFALARVPGLSAERIEEVEEAVASGQLGPILDIEDDEGDGVRIVLE